MPVFFKSIAVVYHSQMDKPTPTYILEVVVKLNKQEKEGEREKGREEERKSGRGKDRKTSMHN